jgi:hypothetical protein
LDAFPGGQRGASIRSPVRHRRPRHRTTGATDGSRARADARGRPRPPAIVADPDDVAPPARSPRWTRVGKWFGYVIVTDREAGIDGLPPDEAGPRRRAAAECAESRWGPSPGLGSRGITLAERPDRSASRPTDAPIRQSSARIRHLRTERRRGHRLIRSWNPTGGCYALAARRVPTACPLIRNAGESPPGAGRGGWR